MHWMRALTHLGGRGFGVDIAVVNLVLLVIHLDCSEYDKMAFRCSGLADKEVDGEQLDPMSPKDEERGKMLFRFVCSQMLLLRCGGKV